MVKLTLAMALLASTLAAQAACSVDDGRQFLADGGSTCPATQNAYTLSANNGSATVVMAQGAASVVNLTAANVNALYAGGGNSYGIGVTGGGTLNATGNVTTESRGTNGRGVYMTDGKIEITGNLHAIRTVRTQGAAIELASSDSNLIVRGTTKMETAGVTGSDGLRNNGIASFTGAVAIDTANYTNSIRNTGTATFADNVTINATNMDQSIWLTGGRLDVAKDLVATSIAGTAARPGLGVNQSGGVLSVDGTATISTVNANAYGLSITAGVFESGGAASASAGPSVLLGAGSAITTTGANADGIVTSSAAAVLVTHKGTISSAAGDGINASAATAGATITSSGDITATAAGKAVVRGSPAADSFTADAGKLSGITLMGAGDDTTTLTGTVDVTAAPQFDGGAGIDTLHIDGISMRAFTAAANNIAQGSNLTLWETIDVKNAGTLKLTGDLFTAANVGTFKLLDASSALDLQTASTATSTINGGFDSTSGQLKVDTVMGDSSSASDVLHITGNTTGSTVVNINNLGGAGAQTTGNGILVVQVDGNSGGTFALAGGGMTVGQYYYTLKQVGKNWYLQSQLNVAPLTVQKQVTAPADAPFSGNIAFTLNCINPAFTANGNIAVSNNSGSAAPIAVTIGSECTVAETLPTPPTGFLWGTPVYQQPTGPMTAAGQTAQITNLLERERVIGSGTLQVNKTVVVPANAPAFSGAINFSVACTNPTANLSGSIAVSNNAGTSAPLTVPAGSTCVVTEQLPAAPQGYQWSAPQYVQPAAIVANATAIATVTNTLTKGTAASSPAPIPTLSQWALILLSSMMAGFAAVGVRRQRMK